MWAIFRAHPSYRSGEEWFDYAEVKWEDDPEFDGSRRAPQPNTPGEARAYVPLDNSYTAPAKIRMFLDLRQSVFKPQSDLERRIYMVIHSAQNNHCRRLSIGGQLLDLLKLLSSGLWKVDIG